MLSNMHKNAEGRPDVYSASMFVIAVILGVYFAYGLLNAVSELDIGAGIVLAAVFFVTAYSVYAEADWFPWAGFLSFGLLAVYSLISLFTGTGSGMTPTATYDVIFLLIAILCIAVVLVMKRDWPSAAGDREDGPGEAEER